MKCNKRYKEIKIDGGGSNYLRKVKLDRLMMDNKMKVLVKLRYGNMGEINKY